MSVIEQRYNLARKSGSDTMIQSDSFTSEINSQCISSDRLIYNHTNSNLADVNPTCTGKKTNANLDLHNVTAGLLKPQGSTDDLASCQEFEKLIPTPTVSHYPKNYCSSVFFILFLPSTQNQLPSIFTKLEQRCSVTLPAYPHG